MRAGIFVCEAHLADATEFCLCQSNPMYLCVTCVPKHADKSTHETFSMEYLEIFGVLGENKAELKRRIETVKLCHAFLDKASAREAAVVLEANNLVTDFVKCYQDWIDKNHRCFDNLVGSLREEVSFLLTDLQVTLSPLAQTLVERSLSLGMQEGNLFCSIPEENALKELTQRCNKALAVKSTRLQQNQYEEEILRGFSKLPPAIQQDAAQIDVQKLIAVQGNQVKCFDVATSQWQQLLALCQNIQVDRWTSSTFISPNRIGICGGGDSGCTRHVGNSAYILEGDGSVQELPHMSTGRSGPGLAWDSVKQTLYVFGGWNGGCTCYTDLRTSEMFLSKWSPLPDMHQGRHYFNPCWHSSILYLCGGDTDSVETYDPRSNTFALQDFTLPENSYTTTVVENGVLSVISQKYISKIQQGRLTSQQHGKYSPWSNCTPLVSEGVVYIVDLPNTCRCIDLSTGEVQMEARFSLASSSA